MSLDLDHDSIYKSLSDSLSRSRTHLVWFEGERSSDIGNAKHDSMVLINTIHAVHKETNDVTVILLEDLHIVLKDWMDQKEIMRVSLEDPDSLTQIEKYFDVDTNRETAKAIDPIQAIAHLLEE